MKKSWYLILVAALLFAACSGATDNPDGQLAAAQGTLDALDQGASHGSSPTQAVPPTIAAGPTETSGVGRANSLDALPIIFEFDDQGTAWENGCWSIRQPMDGFGSGWNEDDHWFGANLNCEMAFDLNLTTSGLYDVFLVGTFAPDFGNVTLTFLRGIETIDFMNASFYAVDIKPSEEIPLGQWHFTVGDTNQFIVKLYGKADQSTDYKFGLDYLKLTLIQPDG